MNDPRRSRLCACEDKEEKQHGTEVGEDPEWDRVENMGRDSERWREADREKWKAYIY